MRSEFYDFVSRNRWNLLLIFSVFVFALLIGYSIEQNKENTIKSMESNAEMQSMQISLNLKDELDEVTQELLAIYDIQTSSPPQSQYEFFIKTEPVLKENTFLSSIYFVDTESKKVFKVPNNSSIPAAYGDNNSQFEIALLISKHDKKIYLSAPYEIAPGNYCYSLLVPYGNNSFFQLSFTLDNVFTESAMIGNDSSILFKLMDNQKVVYTSPDYESQFITAEEFLTTSSLKIYNREMLLMALPADSMLSPHFKLWETFGHWSIYLILLILAVIVMFQMFYIGERKEHEQKLKLSEAKFRSIFNSVNDAIYITDLKGNFLEVNNVTCDTLGYSKDELLKMQRWEIMLHHSPEQMGKKINAVFKHMEFISETVHVSRDGTLIPVELSSRKINYESKDAIISIARDLSESKRAEMLLKSNEELKQLTRMKDLFTDILRHDLLGPASLIKGYTELLLETTDEPEQKLLLEKIFKGNLNLIEMIDNAAKLAKFESIDDLDFNTMDIMLILNSVTERYQTELQAKNIFLKVPSEQKYNALINPIITEVFSNILSNAIKYSPPNSEIFIDINDEETNWKVLITDSGEGVKASDRELIFDRFSRAHKGGVKGSGLGLAIAKRIMDLHGGSIGVNDNPTGKGSVFWFSIKKIE
ncbi:PAS domain S-box protein [uncultured Methanomethylovorans sp.]|uniref:PAS domain-containing sensor histidine kinase n=1 Tax=uncultured Methanomethylovorans sp. TaxID=183759 RepID=UPI002AA710F9|nr:PAS domain S-box protein [uncultured Methanomethylovorans sp.]